METTEMSHELVSLICNTAFLVTMVLVIHLILKP